MCKDSSSGRMLRGDLRVVALGSDSGRELFTAVPGTGDEPKVAKSPRLATNVRKASSPKS